MIDPAVAELLPKVPQGAESVFPKDEYDGRLARLRRVMGERGFDLVLISGAENIFYLTGQQTPGYYTFQCLCVPADGAPFLVIRALEAMNARLNTFIEDISGYPDDANPADAVASVLKGRGWDKKRVAIDQNGWFLTVNLHQRLLASFGKLLDGSGLVEPLRRVKSAREIAEIERAAVANEAGMKAGIAAVRAGASENDAAAAIMSASIAAGGEYVGMEPFVTSGPRSGVPPSACWNRYHASLYRTLAVGKIPDTARAMFAVCEAGLETGIATLKLGNSCADVHDAVQAVIDKAGYTAGYRKRTGYSVGISFAPDWGEGNIMSLYRGVDIPLEAGMVFHVPITLRDYGKFTVAVSETVLVTAGAPRTFSAIGRKIIDV